MRYLLTNPFVAIAHQAKVHHSDEFLKNKAHINLKGYIRTVQSFEAIPKNSSLDLTLES